MELTQENKQLYSEFEEWEFWSTTMQELTDDDMYLYSGTDFMYESAMDDGLV